MIDCEIYEYRQERAKFDRVPSALVGFDHLKPSIIQAYEGGASLDEVATMASDLIGRKVSVDIAWEVLIITAEYVEADDDDLLGLTGAELDAVIRERRRFCEVHPFDDEARFSLHEAENEHRRRMTGG
ncbi:hypothetical protein AAC691_17190 [Nguyenibacter vanlangensis]|uniref:Uncharacterized protein n=1 Tax=Nguyenibacter vanlangensis TaxID=1216886 RepID=A0ABZ3D2L4_9PROT